MQKSHEFAINLIKKYRWNSILLKYWKKLVLVFIMPFLLINSVVYILYNNILKNEFQTSFQHSCSKTVYTLDTLFSDINIHFSQMGYDSRVFYFILTPNNRLTDSNNASNRSKLREQLHFFQLSKEYLDSIQVYSTLNENTLSSTGSALVSDAGNQQWYEYYKETDDADFILPVRNNKTNKIDQLYVCYGIKYKQEIKGLLVYTISADYINKLIQSDLDYSLASFYITDTGQNILYASNNDLETTALSFNPTVSANIFDDKLTLNFQANSDYITEKTFYVRGIFMLCLVVAILLPLLMTLYISLQFYRSIHKIIGILSTNDTDSDMNEIDFILHNISNMVKTNKHFEKEMVQKIQQLKRSQTMALQAQFNPHFLFNTLNIINLMVAKYANGKNDASRSIVLLCDLLAVSMKTNDYILTLEEELELAKKYIEIRRLQHKNAFEIIWDVDKETLDCKVLKLMLQPILENAFQYGMKLIPAGSTFMIRISSHIENGSLLVTVYNNGKGISPEKANELRDILENDDILQSNHIGLNNINQRIKLLYGEAYGCSIASDDDSFSVVITMPVSI